MLAVDRLKIIEKKLSEKGSVIIAELSKEFKVSEETIRRDLEKLEKNKVLKRVRGGAYLHSETDKQVPFEIREHIFLKEKNDIARKTLEFINDGDIIMIDSSTTAICVAQSIEKEGKKITVITNSLKIVEVFQNSKWVKTICLGGTLRKRTKSFTGIQAIEQLKGLRANKAIISCTAIDKIFGITDDSERESKIREKMIEHSSEIFLVVDRTKFDLIESHLIIELQKINKIITDKKLSDDWEKLLKGKKIDVVYA